MFKSYDENTEIASLEEAAECGVLNVTIDDPSDIMAEPIYEGSVERAYMKLRTGEYRGLDLDSDDEVGIILVVEPAFSWVKWDLDHAHESAILWEKFCNKDE